MSSMRDWVSAWVRSATVFFGLAVLDVDVDLDVEDLDLEADVEDMDRYVVLEVLLVVVGALDGLIGANAIAG